MPIAFFQYRTARILRTCHASRLYLSRRRRANVLHTADSSLSLADIVRAFKQMMIGVGLTDLPEGCVPGGLYDIFNTQQMKLITDYVFIGSQNKTDL